jgi:hypothetical protein
MEELNARYILWARDENFKRIRRVRDWQQLTLDLKFCDISTWTLDTTLAEFLRAWDISTPTDTLVGRGTGPGASTNGIAIFRVPAGKSAFDYAGSINDAIFTGIITDVEVDGAQDPETIHIGGESDASFLKDRPIWPNYAQSFNPTTHWWEDGSGHQVAYSTETGYLETVMKSYLYYNLSTGAASGRPLPYFFSGPDYERGIIVTVSSRLETGYDLIKRIIDMSPDERYGFDVKQVAETGQYRLYFRLLGGVDRRDSTVFSTRSKTIKSWKYTEKRPKGNLITIGGICWDGSAVSSDQFDRIFVNGVNADSSTKYGLIEAFEEYTTQNEQDNSNPANPTSLAQIVGDLNNQAQVASWRDGSNLAAEMKLRESESCTWKVDFDLGDTITVDLKGVQVIKTIDSMAVSVTKDQKEEITVTVSDPVFPWWKGSDAYNLSIQNRNRIRQMGRGR